MNWIYPTIWISQKYMIEEGANIFFGRTLCFHLTKNINCNFKVSIKIYFDCYLEKPFLQFCWRYDCYLTDKCALKNQSFHTQFSRSPTLRSTKPPPDKPNSNALYEVLDNIIILSFIVSSSSAKSVRFHFLLSNIVPAIV